MRQATTFMRWPLAALLLLFAAVAFAQPTFDSNEFDDGFTAVDVKAADLTNDGWQDIVVAEASGGGDVFFYRNQGDGTFDQLDVDLISTGYSTIRSIRVADVDGDGDIDVLIAVKDDDSIFWFENISDGDSWVEHLVDDDLDQAYDVVVADIDNDGDNDMFGGAHANTGVICWYENDGDENFTKHVIEATTDTGGIYAVDAGDINGNGSIDVIFTNEGPGSSDSEDMVAFYENNGDDDFGGTGFGIDFSYIGGHTSLLVDFDDDGDNDVLVCSDDSDEPARIAWYENDNGDASAFTKHTIVDFECKRAWVADMDNDGDLDVVGASYNDDGYYWVENVDGDALTWDLHILESSMDRAHRAYPFDMDNDGDLDIVAVGYNSGEALFIAENELTDPIPLAANEHIYYHGWTLMSIPYNVSGYDNAPSEVIGDDMTNPDIAVWQLIGFNYSQGMYYEYQPGVIDNIIEVNHGYWLGIAHSDTNVVDVVGDAVVGDVTVDLEYPWNMLGYPFLEEGDIYDWKILNAEYPGDEFTMAQAADSAWVVPVIHVAAPEFTNWGYWYHFGATDEIRPWYGFWFLTLVDDLQLVMTDPAPGPQIQSIDEEEPSGPIWNDWTARVIARNDSPFDATINFGVNSEASDGFDIHYDWPAPAFPNQAGQNLKMFYEETEWLPTVTSEFLTDVRAPFEQGVTKVYDFTVQSGGSVTLFWPNVDGLVPAGYTAEIVDIDNNVSIDMLSIDEYTFTASGSHPFEIRVTAGATEVEEGETVALPTTPTLNKVYPNPFNPSVTVDYSLPETAQINLAVYDVLGREVATLSNTIKSAGSHKTVWNATGHAAGVYFIQLQAAGTTQMQKAVLVK